MPTQRLTKKAAMLVEVHTQNRPTQTPSDNKGIRCCVYGVGDLFLGPDLSARMKADPAFPFREVSGFFQEADIRFGNLEGPLSAEGKPVKKSSMFMGRNAIQALSEAGFTVVSLANNHVFDYGARAFHRMVELLEKNGILHAGAGLNITDARRPAVVEANGLRVAFLAYGWGFIQCVRAGRLTFGTAPLDRRIILQDLTEARRQADVVIVSVHWGYERELYPLPSHRRLAHKLIDAGADLIIGHHPHVLQGIEMYGRGAIAYSLGNFCFADPGYFEAWGGRDRCSAILKCSFSHSGLERVEIIPTVANESFQPVPLEDVEKEEALARMKMLSEPLTRRDYALFWQDNRVRKDLPDYGGSAFLSAADYRRRRLQTWARSVGEAAFSRLRRRS